MAKPSHLDFAALELAHALQSVAFAAARDGSALDRRAVAFALEACDKLSDWRRDTTETSRRHAHAKASAASALCLSEVAPLSPVREAVKRLAFGIERACEADALAALQLAQLAPKALFAPLPETV